MIVFQMRKYRKLKFCRVPDEYLYGLAFQETEIISSLHYYNQAGLGFFAFKSLQVAWLSLCLSAAPRARVMSHQCRGNQCLSQSLVCVHLQPLQLLLGLYLPAHTTIRIFLRPVRTQLVFFCKTGIDLCT